MDAPSPRLRRGRIGVALGDGWMVAVRLRRGPRGLHPVDSAVLSLPPGRPDAAGVEDAVRAAAGRLGLRGGRADVALLRPLAAAKRIALPPVGAEETVALARRGVRRHFAVGEEPMVVDARRLPGRRIGALAPALAACAAEAVAEAVVDGLAAAGWKTGRIVPGAAALAAVADRVRSAGRGRVAVAAPRPGGVDLVVLDDGVPTTVAPVAASSDDVPSTASAVVAAARGTGEEVAATLLLLAPADDPLRAEVGARAGEVGLRLLDAASSPGDDLPPGGAAALGAALAGRGAPHLLPPSLAAAQRRAARRRRTAFLSTAAVLLVSAAGLHLLDLHRELEAVEAGRATLAPAVREARAARASVEGLRSRLETLAALEASRPAWTREVAALAAALPDSAWVRVLAADSAGLRIEGDATVASVVVPALEASPRFGRAAFAGPVRWEEGAGVERYDVSVALGEEEGG